MFVLFVFFLSVVCDFCTPARVLKDILFYSSILSRFDDIQSDARYIRMSIRIIPLALFFRCIFVFLCLMIEVLFVFFFGATYFE